MKNTGKRIASVAAAAALGLSLPTGAATAAENGCARGEAVRTQIQQVLDDLRGDVSSSAGRAVRQALKEALQTFRGADADTAAERRHIGQEIRVLVSRRADAQSTVKRRATSVEIQALREQRERGRFTAAEKAELRAALRRLRTAVDDEVDDPEVGSAVSRALRTLFEDFDCER